MRILCYSLLKEIDCLPQIGCSTFIPEEPASQVKFVRRGIFSWFRSYDFPLRTGKLCLQRIGDGAGNLAFNGEEVRKLAIISLRPQVRVIARVDQLRVDSSAIRSTLNTSFHHMRDAKFIRNLAQVRFHAALVLHN